MDNKKILKSKIRNTILKIRNSIETSQRAYKSYKILNKLFRLPEFKNSHTIFFYASYGSEVDTFPAIEKALSLKKRVVLSKVDLKNKLLRLYQIDKIQQLLPGYKNIPEPPKNSEKEVNISEINLIIVPGVAFDTNGNRLGYGGGYYDSILSRTSVNTKTIGLAFEEQITTNLPIEKHDVPVNIIITDKRIIRVDREYDKKNK